MVDRKRDMCLKLCDNHTLLPVLFVLLCNPKYSLIWVNACGSNLMACVNVSPKEPACLLILPSPVIDFGPIYYSPSSHL